MFSYHRFVYPHFCLRLPHRLFLRFSLHFFIFPPLNPAYILPAFLHPSSVRFPHDLKTNRTHNNMLCEYTTHYLPLPLPSFSSSNPRRRSPGPRMPFSLTLAGRAVKGAVYPGARCQGCFRALSPHRQAQRKCGPSCAADHNTKDINKLITGEVDSLVVSVHSAQSPPCCFIRIIMIV